jgi:ubiquinone/menaquinone biosynthesis C-methylase UbiE
VREIRPAEKAQPEPAADRKWFFDHYDEAAGIAVDFLSAAGVALEGRTVADIGSGDGIIDLGIAHKGRPARLVGYDLRRTDASILRERARLHRVAEELPKALEFEESGLVRTPAPDDTFDVVISWSAFEHVQEPVMMFTEIRRILKPSGVLFLQLWPFWFSQKGSHLWDWFDLGFHHLLQHEDDILDVIRNSSRHPEDVSEYMIDEFRHLNRITVDELQRAMLAGGLAVRRFQLMSHLVDVPAAALRYPLSDLGISGVQLLAGRF